MDGNISGVSKETLVDLSTPIKDTSSSRTSEVNSKIESNLSKIPKNPSEIKTSSKKNIPEKPTSSLKKTNRRGVKTNSKKVKISQQKARAGLPKKIGVTIPPFSRAVSLDSRMISKEIQSLPKNQRQQAIANAQKTLQTRINNGYKIYQKIQSGHYGTGEGQTRATPDEIRDFMTFLTAKATQKTFSFSEGAFNLPDPGNKIRNFLDSCTEVYQRNSTHIEGFSDHTGCGHRGIDLKLPYGQGTLLYGAMKDGVMGTKGDRIYLKMESHGCRISTLSKDKVDKEGPPSRPKRFFSDLWSSIKHGIGGIKTLLGLQKTEGTRKERVDKDIEKEFKELVQMAKDSGIEGLEEMLNKNNPAGKRTGYGIRTMMANIKNVLEKAKGEHDLGDGMFEIELDDAKKFNLPEDFQKKLEDFQKRIQNHYDHVEHRIGNEVILSTKELNGTDNSRELQREGQARAIITQLMAIKDPNSMSTEDLQKLVTNLQALAGAVDGADLDDQSGQINNALKKAMNGLSPEQKEHVKGILMSDKIQDLSNEFLMKTMEEPVKIPGKQLTPRQSHYARGVMSIANKILIQLTREAGGEPRVDGNFTQSQITALADTIIDLGESLSIPRIQEGTQKYLSKVEIQDRSALKMLKNSTGIMVLGSSAKAMFPKGLPKVNQREVNAKSKELVQDLLANPTDEVDGSTLWGAFGVRERFMWDFKRDPIFVNGKPFGGPMPDPENKSELSKEELDELKNEFYEKEFLKFTEAVGGPSKVVNVTRLMYQDVDKVSEVTHFLHTGKTGEDLSNGLMEVIKQKQPIDKGGTRSITINEDGSAMIKLIHSKGRLDEVNYSTEVNITLDKLDEGETKVLDVKVGMIFTSND